MKSLLKHRLYIIVFTTGASIMMLEITGSRVLAPYFGASVIVWTSLIGLIMASLSFGYWWGGRLVDRKPSLASLGVLILWAALGIAVLAVVKGVIAGGVQAVVNDLRVGAVLVTLILFCPPSVLLATVSPYAARLSIDSAKTSGETMGRLYALSTLGCIVGTFASGFFLLAILGNTMLLLFIALILACMGILALMGEWNTKRIVLAISTFALIVFGVLMKDKIVESKTLLADIDTSYQRIQVHEGFDDVTNRPARFILTDGFGVQSARFTDTTDPKDLVLSYTEYYRLADHFVPDPERMLMIGGAAYSVPGDMLARHPNAYMDVAELDPGMTQVARDFFDLRDDDRMSITHDDGRTVLGQAKTNYYDTILVDAFHSIVIPFQLTTHEAVAEMHRSLKDEGVVAVNIISSIEGQSGRLLQAEYATYAEVFDHVYVFPVQTPGDGKKVQNIMLVAVKGDAPAMNNSDKQIQSYLNHWWRDEILDRPILTDDYAPVEKYILDMI